MKILTQFLLNDLPTYLLLMPSDKLNSRTGRTRDLIPALINVASS